jgi:hypothetical protein
MRAQRRSRWARNVTQHCFGGAFRRICCASVSVRSASRSLATRGHVTRTVAENARALKPDSYGFETYYAGSGLASGAIVCGSRTWTMRLTICKNRRCEDHVQCHPPAVGSMILCGPSHCSRTASFPSSPLLQRVSRVPTVDEIRSSVVARSRATGLPETVTAWSQFARCGCLGYA